MYLEFWTRLFTETNLVCGDFEPSTRTEVAAAVATGFAGLDHRVLGIAGNRAEVRVFESVDLEVIQAAILR